MNIFDKIITFIKLPFKIIVLIAIILGLLLFLPKNIQEILKLEAFIDEYGMYFGISFLFSIGYILFMFFSWLINKIHLLNNSEKIIKKIKEDISCLLPPSIFLLREFYLQNKDVIEVPIENTEFNDLYNKKILILASINVRSFVFGKFASVRINPLIKDCITPEILKLPKTEFTKKEIEKIKSERPLFVAQINYVNNLFNFPWIRC